MFAWVLKMRSIQEDVSGSLIIWESPNWETRKAILLPLMVDLSPSDYFFDSALKSPMTVVRKGLQLNESSRFISKFFRKSWNSSWDWLGILLKWMK